MKYLFILMVQIAVYLPALEGITYRKEGKYMIGAIIPLTQDSSAGNCSKANPEGATVAEALVYAFDQIERESDFADLLKKTSLGYDIRDNCGTAKGTRAKVYEITQESHNYKHRKSKKIPDQVVISEFTNKDIDSLPILNAEGIIQASYAEHNARLRKTGGSDYPIKRLVSVYPEYTKKISAVSDIVKEFQFQYVYAITNDDVQGAQAMKELSSNLKSQQICVTELLASTVKDVKGFVDKITENRRINVVVIHTTRSIELELYKEFVKRNITDVIFITTRNWNSDMKSLKPYKRVVAGMLDVYYKKGSQGFKNYMTERDVPYTNRPWLQSLFVQYGGDRSCLTTAGSGATKCTSYRNKVRKALKKNAPTAEYAYQAVLAIAFALKTSMKESIPLLNALAGLHVDIPALSMDPLVFNNKLSAERSKFMINNLRINKAELSEKWVGVWNDKNQMGRPLNVRKKDVMWKGGSKETPVSVCSASCAPGYERSFLGQDRCCWECSRCPNDTASNITNTNRCMTCPEGTVVQPDQAGCKAYKLLYFEWFGGVGAVLIILMIIGVVLILFALGVFSQNSNHELVVRCNYNSLLLFMLACLVLIFSPIPLLINTPNRATCLAYIIMFNTAISVVVGILTSRSAPITGLFDENGVLTKGTLGRFPRTLVVLLVVALQLVVSFVVYEMEVLHTMHNYTDQWDERYHECSSWASCTFWAGFIYNVVASIIGSSLSCSSTKMSEDNYELKYVLIAHLMLYMFDIVGLCIFFSTNDEHLAGGQAINCILFAYAFYFSYLWPKIFAIMFRSKGNKLIVREPSEHGDEEGAMLTTAIHASSGFKHHGIVQMKVRESEDNDDD